MLTENDLVTTMDTNHGTYILKPTGQYYYPTMYIN